MLRTHQQGRRRASAVRAKDADGVVEPDTRLVFAVLAAGVILGALVTPPAKSNVSVPLAGIGTSATQSADR
ncbi:MAG TPA: hypothetical protein VMS30_06110 [Phycisphaerales bacterium]|nr:hypothetical protein [Phycisphaerales bacterium]